VPKTHGEALLVRELERRGIRGIRTNVQLGAQPNEADIVVERSKLVIEVDGPWHCQRDKIRRDEWKDRYYKALGYYVIRVTTYEVYFLLPEIARRIVWIAREREALLAKSTGLQWLDHPLLRETLFALRIRILESAA
jgi:very-short-patch-repair endonuclease